MDRNLRLYDSVTMHTAVNDSFSVGRWRLGDQQNNLVAFIRLCFLIVVAAVWEGRRRHIERRVATVCRHLGQCRHINVSTTQYTSGYGCIGEKSPFC